MGLLFSRSLVFNNLSNQGAAGTPAWASQAYISVAPGVGDGEFTSVKAAVDSILDATEENPYLVEVSPGVYEEDPFTIPPFVGVVGKGTCNLITLVANDLSQHFVTISPGGYLGNVTIDGPTDIGAACVYHYEFSEDVTCLRNIAIKNGYYGIYTDVEAGDPHVGNLRILGLANIDSGTPINTLIKIEGKSKVDIQNLSIRANQDVTAACITGVSISGPDAKAIIQVWMENDAHCSDVLYVNNGATCRLSSLTVNDCNGDVLHVGPDGASVVELGSCVIHAVNATAHLRVTSALADVRVDGALDKTKVFIQAGASTSALFTDVTPGEEGVVSYGGTPDSTVPLRDYAINTYSTGYLSGGEISRVAGLGNELKVLVTAGAGFLNTGTAIERVDWAQNTLDVPADSSLWIYIDPTGVLGYTDTEPSNTTSIELGRVQTDATKIIFIGQHHHHVDGVTGRLGEYLNEIFGPISIDGGIVTEHNAPSLQLVSTGGHFYNSLDYIQFAASAAPCSFSTWRTDGAGGWTVVTGQTSVDNVNYDDGAGALVAMTDNTKYKKDALYVSVSGNTTEYHLVYGQEEFADQATAEDGAYPTVDNPLANHALRLAGIVTKKNDPSIITIVDARPRVGTLASSTALNPTDHSTLLNLDFASSNHTGFEGTVNKGAANGYASLDANSKVEQNPASATAVPTADSIPISDNAGELTAWVADATAVVKGKVQLSDAAMVASDAGAQTPGLSSLVSRRDHKHSITVGTPVSVGTANSEGVATTIARSDHVHAHGIQTGDTQHALVVAGVSHGFMDKADKTKLDSFGAGGLVDFQTVADDTVTTTTSSTFQTKVTLATGALTGTYRVGMFAGVTSANSAKRVQCRLYNTSDNVEYCSTDIAVPASGVYEGFTGFNYVTLAGVSKNISIQFASQDNAATVSCRRARIEFWRVA
jgi:hypothetical protein